jgi:hypothetical protein
VLKNLLLNSLKALKNSWHRILRCNVKGLMSPLCAVWLVKVR